MTWCHGVNGVEFPSPYTCASIQGGGALILASVILKQREEGEEERERERDREKRGEIITIAISLPEAWKGIDVLYFITFPVKNITKNFILIFLRMIWN